MAKKRSINPIDSPLSKEELMRVSAMAIIEMRKSMAKAKAKLEDMEHELAVYITENQLLHFEGLMYVETSTQPKWVGAKGKTLENKKSRLANEAVFAPFMKLTIDKTAVLNALPTSLDLQKALAAQKIQLLEGEKSWSLKQVK